MGLAIISPIALALLLPAQAIADRTRLRWLRPVMLSFGACMLVNLFAGTAITTRLVYATGTAGTGRVTGETQTSALYNSAPVWRYFVDIQTPAGQTIGTTFKSNDFNVYPPRNGVTYPSVGESFRLRYLPMFPQDFVIVQSAESGS